MPNIQNGSKIFRDVTPLRPGRSGFDLSSRHRTMLDAGMLVPIWTEDLVPGDKIKLSGRAVLRFQPTVAPIMDQYDAYLHAWFVAYRNIWKTVVDPVTGQPTAGWEKFISGGEDGNDTQVPPAFIPNDEDDCRLGTLWDYFGHPANSEEASASNWFTTWEVESDPNMCPRIWQWAAYNDIWNENYRDENLQTTRRLPADNTIAYRAWEKDYFTASLPEQQRGTAPSFPLSGLLPITGFADFGTDDTVTVPLAVNSGGGDEAAYVRSDRTNTDPGPLTNIESSGQTSSLLNQQWGTRGDDLTSANTLEGTANAAGATTFTISDFREVAAIQQWQERNMRSGVRYPEFIYAHFSVRPQDQRLQRPEYIGGLKWPIITSEVLQTGSTDEVSPQGNMAGHGIGFINDKIGTYFAPEYGIVVILLSVLARPSYANGIRKNWRKIDRYAYYQPEFAHLSEQPVLTGELFSTGDPDNDNAEFGFQPIYDEYRWKPSIVTHQMRPDEPFEFWTSVRNFTSTPHLNASFISAQDTPKRVFAVQNVPSILADVGIYCDAIRPMPYKAEPGLTRI